MVQGENGQNRARLTKVAYWDCWCGFAIVVQGTAHQPQMIEAALDHLREHLTEEIDVGVACATCETVFHRFDKELAARCCNDPAMKKAVAASEIRLRRTLVRIGATRPFTDEDQVAAARLLGERQTQELMDHLRIGRDRKVLDDESFALAVADVETVSCEGNPRGIRRLG